MTDKFRISLDADSLEDSRTEGELEKLRAEVKQKQSIVAEQSEIIASLRQLNNDIQAENEELETNQQLLSQRMERLTKELGEKNEELEVVWHARKEVEQAYDNRTDQMKKLVEDLAKTKKELSAARTELQAREEQLQLYQERMNAMELELVSSKKKRANRELDDDGPLAQELRKLKQDLEVSEESWQLERQHKDRYARENYQLNRKVNELTKQLDELRNKFAELEATAHQEPLTSPPPPPLPPKSGARSQANQQLHHHHQHVTHNHYQQQDENRTHLVSGIHFPMADEVGEIMEPSSDVLAKKRSVNEFSVREQQCHDIHLKRSAPGNINESALSVNMKSENTYCPNHRIKKTSFFHHDPIAEEKLRAERARELARRNMLSKPLHQTSYPLELDTFDTTNLTEQEIKRGNVHAHQPRQPLANTSNQRKPVKKAEAFIV